jgi:hypothetical protein
VGHLAISTKHWSKNVGMDPCIWLVQNWKWVQWRGFQVCKFSLLAAETGLCVFEHLRVDIRPKIGWSELDVFFCAAWCPEKMWSWASQIVSFLFFSCNQGGSCGPFNGFKEICVCKERL